MNLNSKRQDLVIVDNSSNGWTVLRYLEQWTGISNAFDIATGYFEIGALLALDGKWQKLEKIRILMGNETTSRTRKALLASVRKRAEGALDRSIGRQKRNNPFLHGVPAILNALNCGQIECRIYDKQKFHAKTYITHSALGIVAPQALVGSSNFTRPGLEQNVELNLRAHNSNEVDQLQDWFEEHWNKAKEVTAAVVKTIERHVRHYTPIEIYAKALQEFCRGHEMTATEWDETRSRMFPNLDRYQKEAYWALMKIARQHGGAFLCDGVGLGKTFVGLMLIERLVLHAGKRVVLFAPKAAREGVWEPHLREWLPHIGGFGSGVDFSNLAVFNHTDLSRRGDFPSRFKRIAALADVVIIDEAHHFRNPGRRGLTGDKEPSRYYRLYDLLDSTERPKRVFLLTATPINNRLSDLRHMIELFTRQNQAYFARTLGVNNLRTRFNEIEKVIQQRVGHDLPDATDEISQVQQMLSADEVFRSLVVQRSRAYARESQIRETGESAAFPMRLPPKVAVYSIQKSYGTLLRLFEQAFERENPLFTLPMYYPLHWYIGDQEGIDPLEENRQKQVIGLIRTNFLKRFESSVAAFEVSCDRLLNKLLAFVEVHSETDAERRRLARWKGQNEEILRYTAQRQLQFLGESDDIEDDAIIPIEILEAVDKLDRKDYDVSDMLFETFLDLDQIVQFLREVRRFDPKHDDKLQRLIRLLKSGDLANQKVIVFTEFAHTARYIKHQLDDNAFVQVAQVDSASKTNRADIIRQFSPYYNDCSSVELTNAGQDEICILISTDVLSEGLNLQDASKMINYDIHWNPVRLMQRIGRVDRRMNLRIEERIAHDHPELRANRGKVQYWNFLPPDDLNTILTLYTKVTQKTLLISKTFGIEGKQLLTPEDDFDALKEFNHSYEGTRTAIEDIHLEYQELKDADPSLESRLRVFPSGVFSGRECATKRLRGVFFCYALPAFDKNSSEFTEQAGSIRWYFHDFHRNIILEDPGQIIANIRSTPDTPRNCVIEEKTLMRSRSKVQQHIKNSYLKRIDAPVGVNPVLKCWMELNED